MKNCMYETKSQILTSNGAINDIGELVMLPNKVNNRTSYKNVIQGRNNNGLDREDYDPV